ncbi:S66 peptidase family protein [Desulfobacula sp.]|uniref:S66 family peptidase n=1 Tax=Desulfobacula sp. TaxID=2593537 RepID=UPI00262D6E73|nr:S66 peptidase family protein [Desulfobacula sp.]
MIFELLKKGDTIAFFSPSSPGTVTAPKRFERAKGFLESKGFNLLPGNLTGKKDVYRSGNTKQRADELNDLISNPDVDCILSTIGGINSNALLPYIDYDAFKQHPKIIIGHSDVTSILLALYTKTGITTFYGPALIHSFGEFSPFLDMTWAYFKDILLKKQSLPYTYKMPDYWTDDFINWEEKTNDKTLNKNQWITVNKGQAEGKILGGTLNAISTIIGTEYMPLKDKNTILFIEDTTKTAAYMERLFSLLKAHNYFENVCGIILGKHEQYDDQNTSKRPHDILMEIAGKTDIPILGGFDCCHTHPCFTLPLGKKIRLDATKQTVSLLESWVE